jgi:hypothetical protein
MAREATEAKRRLHIETDIAESLERERAKRYHARMRGGAGGADDDNDDIGGRGLQSSTSQLNLSRFGHTSSCPPV